MRALLIGALAAAACVGAGCDSASSSAASASAAVSLPDPSLWMTHRDAEGAFEAKFPGAPSIEHVEPPQKSPEDMRLSVTNATYADDFRLLVATKLVLTDVGRYECEGGLNGMVKSSLAGMGCAADEDVAKAFQGFPGREVTFSCSKRPMRGIMRVGCDASALASKRVLAYSTMAAFQNEAWSADAARAFLDGFVLLDK